MIRLIRAETIKLRKRRLYWVMLLILIGLMAVTGFFLIVFPQVVEGGMDGFTGIERPEAYIVGAQQAASQTWFPLILAVVFLGAEVTTTTWAATLTREARRWAHLIAKAVVLTGFSWAAMLVVIGLWAVATTIVAAGSGGPSPTEWVGVVWKVGLLQLVWVGLGLGAIGMLRSTGPAIGLVIAFSFGESILTLWEPYRTIGLSSSTTALFGDILDMGGFGGPFGMGDPAPFAVALIVVIGWGVVGLAAAWAALTLRDA